MESVDREEMPISQPTILKLPLFSGHRKQTYILLHRTNKEITKRFLQTQN
jgi:hypothetical protein